MCSGIPLRFSKYSHVHYAHNKMLVDAVTSQREICTEYLAENLARLRALSLAQPQPQ